MMRNHGYVWVSVILGLGLLPSGGAQASGGAFGGGDGSAANPYVVQDIQDVAAMGGDAAHLAAHYVLGSDIDAAGFADFRPIGYDTIPDNESNAESIGFQGAAFTGTLDGQGHVIRNLAINRPEESYIGLFGCIDGSSGGGAIRNLGIEDGTVVGGYNTGALAGAVNTGVFMQCHTSCLVRGFGRTGGLVGESSGEAVIRACYTTGDTFCHEGGAGMSMYGGLIGKMAGTVSQCFATGDAGVPEPFAYMFGQVGGLIGAQYGAVSDSFATGGARGSGDIGGVTGKLYSGSITGCYAHGPVRGTRAAGVAGNAQGTIAECYSKSIIVGSGGLSPITGGLVGLLQTGGLVRDCLFDATIYAGNAVGQVSGFAAAQNCYGRTTAEMQQQATYTTAHTGSPWDFGTRWAIAENQSYPWLQALGEHGELIGNLEPGEGEGEGEGETSCDYYCYRNLFLGQLAMSGDFDEIIGVTPEIPEMADAEVLASWLCMVAWVLATPDAPRHAETLAAYTHNVAVIDALTAPASLISVAEGAAALCLTSAGVREVVLGIFEMPIGFEPDSLWIVMEGKTVAEPLSGVGDLDGDGIPNHQEYLNVYAESGANQYRFVQVVTNPNLDGSEPVPVAGGLGIIVLGAALVGVRILPRRSPAQVE